MSLESLLGNRVKTVVSSNKEKLSHKDSVLEEIKKQIQLEDGKNPPMVSKKQGGKVMKDSKGETVMVPIKSWFNDNTGQFKPTPNGMTFFKGDENSFTIGTVSKMKILEVFQESVKNDTYKDDLDDWGKRCDTRNNRIGKKK